MQELISSLKSQFGKRKPGTTDYYMIQKVYMNKLAAARVPGFETVKQLEIKLNQKNKAIS
jgi:uncharacterized protein YggE